MCVYGFGFVLGGKFWLWVVFSLHLLNMSRLRYLIAIKCICFMHVWALKESSIGLRGW